MSEMSILTVVTRSCQVRHFLPLLQLVCSSRLNSINMLVGELTAEWYEELNLDQCSVVAGSCYRCLLQGEMRKLSGFWGKSVFFAFVRSIREYQGVWGVQSSMMVFSR